MPMVSLKLMAGAPGKEYLSICVYKMRNERSVPCVMGYVHGAPSAVCVWYLH